MIGWQPVDCFRQAADGFARAAELDPRAPVVRLNHGRWLMRDGKSTAALVEFEATRALSLCDPAVLLDLARAHLARGDRANAAVLWRRAHEIVPDDRAMAKLGEQLGRTGGSGERDHP